MGNLNPKRMDQKQSDSEASKLIRKVRRVTRKRYSSEEKIRIVMEEIRGDEPVSTICRREGIHSNVYYG